MSEYWWGQVLARARLEYSVFQTFGCQGKERMRKEWIGSLGLADSNYYIENKQHCSTVQYRELYSISCSKASWKRMRKNMYVYN